MIIDGCEKITAPGHLLPGFLRGPTNVSDPDHPADQGQTGYRVIDEIPTPATV